MVAISGLGSCPRSSHAPHPLGVPVAGLRTRLAQAPYPIVAFLQPPIQTTTHSAPPVLQNQGLFHCLTTPAPDEKGRPPPARTNEKPDTMARWQADHRRFAPWQYQAKYLVTSQQGTTSLAPAAMREQMMGFSATHTANMTHDPTEYHRNKALGNTWHVPTATWLLFIILLNTLAVPATSITYTPIQRAAAIWLASPVQFGPPPRPTPHTYMPQFSWRDHLQWARTLDTSHTPKPLDPTLVWCVQAAAAFHPMAEFRKQAVEEIQQLVDDMEDVTAKWKSQLPQHVHHAYTTAGSAAQVPVFIHLLKQIQYPQANILEQELTQGFKLMGQLQPGTNWYIRTDQKYLQPKSSEQFADHSQQYVHRKLASPRVDDHYEFMLAEIVQEVKAGRMNGPYRQPTSWTTKTIAPAGYDLALLHLPHQNPKIAMAFSIKQTGSDGKDKIRRGEDWRRSGHNSTCIMHDQPFHHTPDHFASLVMQTHQTRPTADMHVWGHDHDGAYRQLPLDNPESAYVLLQTPDGPTLWSHNVLLFGSSASVWGYNRFGDAMVSVSRILLVPHDALCG